MSLVLLFNQTAHASQAARLHADTCSKVAESLAHVAVIRDDVDAEVQSLTERGYDVKRCGCCEVSQ